jgi:hypothetical protein
MPRRGQPHADNHAEIGQDRQSVPEESHRTLINGNADGAKGIVLCGPDFVLLMYAR